jgi:hypothetical protein
MFQQNFVVLGNRKLLYSQGTTKLSQLIFGVAPEFFLLGLLGLCASRF